jgi:hypothetical protein
VISSHGGRKRGSRSPRTRCGLRGFSFLQFVAICPWTQFALFGKCYDVSEGSIPFCKVGNRSLSSKLVPLDYLQTLEYSVDSREEIFLGKPTDLVQGTLDLLILKTISLEPMNGWAIAKRIVQVSGNVLQVQQGSLYPALHRLEHQVGSGPSGRNRRTIGARNTIR